MTKSSFPRGYVLGLEKLVRPDGFIEGPILPNFFVDSLCKTDASETEGGKSFVIVIGTAETLVGESHRVADLLLQKLAISEDLFFEALDTLVGRFVVIYRGASSIRVVGDATAMRPVFYAEQGGVIASHSELIVSSIGEQESFSLLPFSSSFPANFTPYKGVRVLLPNFYLELSTGRISRFWPRQPITSMSVEKAAHEVLEKSVEAVRLLAMRRNSWLALTAGLDSRVTLAAFLAAGVDFQTFTYGKNADTRMDRLVASHLARRFGLKHSEIPTERVVEDLQKRLERAHYWNHHRSAVGPLSRAVGDDNAAIFSANILEIGQSNYRKLEWRGGLEEPRAASQMAEVYYRKLSRKAKGSVETYGRTKYLNEVSLLFQQMIDETGGPSRYLDPFDDYYWTFRMGTWHGPSSLEKDFYGEPLNPFNARCIIEPLISVSKLDQYDLSVFMRLITLADNRLLDVPINPSDLSWL